MAADLNRVAMAVSGAGATWVVGVDLLTPLLRVPASSDGGHKHHLRKMRTLKALAGALAISVASA